MTVPSIDTHDFSRRADSAAGRVQVAELERLAGLLVSPDGAVDWRLAGRSDVGADGSRQSFLRLELGAVLTMGCVRCLEPVEVALDIGRDYRMVANEAQAEVEDPDEDDVDLLVSSRQFDLGTLIEDEAIMALPAAPRHDACRAPALPESAQPADEGAGEAAPPTAFAALAALRRREPDDDGSR